MKLVEKIGKKTELEKERRGKKQRQLLDERPKQNPNKVPELPGEILKKR